MDTNAVVTVKYQNVIRSEREPKRKQKGNKEIELQ